MIDAKDIGIDFPLGLDAIYARSSLHLDDEDLNNLFIKLLPNLKIGGYLMIEGKTSDDFKIKRSNAIAPNLVVDFDGHIRRVWDKEYVEMVCQKFGLKLVDSGITTENIKGQETLFVHFIILK